MRITGLRAQAQQVVRRAVGSASTNKLADAFVVVGELFSPPLSPRLVKEAYFGGRFLGVETAERIAAEEAAVLHLELSHIDAQLRAWQCEMDRVRRRLEHVGNALRDAEGKLDCPSAGANDGSPSASSCAASHQHQPHPRASSPGSRGMRTALRTGSQSGRTASLASPLSAEGC